jgi:molybdate transport system substrate-binding protein
VALSLTLATDDGQLLPVDDRLHEPIDQALVVCRHGRNAVQGRAFASLVNSPEGRRIMNRYGFVRPGDAMVRGP